jgi:hypothetical protein
VTFFATGFATGFVRAGASALLTGPGFAPALAAAKILAVSRCTFFLAPSTSTGFAVAVFFADGCLAAGFGVAFGSEAGLPLPALAIASISWTLGRPDEAGFDAAGFVADAGGSEAGNSLTPVSGTSALDSVAGFSDSVPDCLLALAAANMSATDIFFFSAIKHLRPTATQHPKNSGTTRSI